MFDRRAALLAFACVCLLALVPIGLHAQSATTGMVQGVVKDPTGAVIPGATVVLTSKATNATTTTTTDATGHFSFPAVNPGSYSLRVSATGFQSFIVSNVTVQVTKAYTVPVSMKIGTASQTVTVAEVPGAELQTTNASIGTTIGGNAMLLLPSAQRNITSLLSLQPAVAPMTTGDITGGQVAGAMSDQTTFLVDGGDATDDLAGTNNYASVPGQPQPSPFIQVGVDTTQEMRMVTSSPTAGFSRSQGGEMVIVSKRGTNQFHGSLYEYYTGSTLGANSWSLNRIGEPKPHRVNNRFGFTFGGPLLRNRLWFFGNYEGRRFRQSASIGTDVPTQTARNGELQFYDAQGNAVVYNLATSTNCGPSGGLACDPRHLGIDPTIQNYWKNEPLPNVPGTGDKLNSEEFLKSYSTPINEDYGLARLDYRINAKWHLYGTFRYQKLNYQTTSPLQLSIIPGDQNIISGTPVQPRFVTFMLTGQIGSHFTSQTHGSFMRDWWAWNRATLSNPPGVTNVSGGTLQVSGEGRTGAASSSKPWADPINFNTQDGRSRLWAAKDWYLAEDDSWLHGNHNVSFGGSWYFWNITHLRTDNVLGGLTTGPIYWVGSKYMSSGGFVSTPPSQTPPICQSTAYPGSTGCLKSTDEHLWDSMYSAMLGLVDHSSQVITANGQFVPNPPGTPAVDHVHIGSFYTYVQDMWQMKPTVTLTYGLSFGAQFPPKELDGKQVLQQYTATGQPVRDINSYFAQRNAAFAQGNIFPAQSGSGAFSFSPIGAVPGYTRPVNTYWGQFGPRVAIAWQPPFNNKFFGNRQTVIRAGYSILWNRTSAVGLVMTPLLGDGLAQIVGCNAPVISGACGSVSGTDASNAFRIGIDGNGLAMPPAQGGYPLTPDPGFSSLFGFNLDPAYKPAWSHDVTVDMQRSFPNNWLIDIGYIGRFSRNLELGADLGASDMFAKDPRSGQTMAQAFDAVSRYVRGGGGCTGSGTLADPAVCPGLNKQPFFENFAAPGNTGPSFCQTTYGSTCTAVAALDSGDAFYGDLASFMQFNYDFIASQTLDPNQFLFNFWNYSGGWASYNAGFISLHKAFSQGLSLSLNYTYSHAISTQGLNQQYIIYSNLSPYDNSTGLGSATFDRRHVANVSWYYELPFGTGKRYSTGSSFLNRIIGGWYSSGIYTVHSGLPLCINADGNYGDFSGFGNSINSFGTCAVSAGSFYGAQGRHDNVYGTSGASNPNSVATNGDPATGGTGINIFSDPISVYNSMSRPYLTQNLRPGQDNLNEPLSWNVDLSVGKNIAVTERYKAIFTADFFNAFNIVTLGDPSLDLSSPQSFGVVTSQGNSPRTIQLGLRFEF